MMVAVEGGENDAQWQLLRELNCPVLQGYHLVKLLPTQVVTDWIKTFIPAHIG